MPQSENNLHLHIFQTIFQISDSFRKFGLADNENNVLVVVADDIDGSTMSAVCNCIKGEIINVDDICSLSDTKLIQKVWEKKSYVMLFNGKYPYIRVDI